MGAFIGDYGLFTGVSPDTIDVNYYAPDFASVLVRRPATVPLPAGIWLFGSAMAWFAFISRRRKQKVISG